MLAIAIEIALRKSEHKNQFHNNQLIETTWDVAYFNSYLMGKDNLDGRIFDSSELWYHAHCARAVSTRDWSK